MDAEITEAIVICALYDPKLLGKFGNVEANCAECERTILVSEDAQKMKSSQTLTTYLCAPCAVKGSPFAHSELLPGTRDKIVESIGEAKTKKFEEDFLGMPLSEVILPEELEE